MDTGCVIYFLALHEPYTSEEHPVLINGTIVRSDTLLHPAITQPDGGRIFRCINEVQSRPGPRLVPISTLTFELDGGNLWPWVGNWEKVAEDVATLARHRGCDALPLGLPELDAILLAGGAPNTRTVVTRDGPHVVGPADRAQVLEKLMRHVERFEAEQPWWPGDGLTPVPTEPVRMPFKLWEPS